MHTKEALQPTSVDHLLNRWDDGEPIVTISMGGMGGGYERVIQTLAVELVRHFKDEEVPPRRSFIEGDREFSDWGEEALSEIMEEHDLHPSGAQYGAAKNLGYRILLDGVETALDSAPEDRLLAMDKELKVYRKLGE